MLGPYITSVVPYCCSVVPYCCSVAPLLLLLYHCSPHIFIIMPHKTPLLLLLALILLLLGQLGLYYDPMDSYI